MASCENFDLYNCEVCFENMLDKNPRFLSCFHSFCTGCLNKLITQGKVVCPTCRQETPVENDCVENLTVNFTLLKVKEHMDRLVTSKSTVCQLCLSQTALLKCQECIQLLCDDCVQKHNSIRKFKEHKLLKLCQKHKEGMITHLCARCVQPACGKCVITEHAEHEDDVETYEEGIKLVTTNLTQYQTQVKESIQTVEKMKAIDLEKLEKVTTVVENLKDIKQYYMKKVTDTEEQLNSLSDIKLEGENCTKSCDLKIQQLKSIMDLLQQGLVQIRNGLLYNVCGIKLETEKTLGDMEQVFRFNLPDMTFQDPRSGKKLVLGRIILNDIKYLREPFLVKTVDYPENTRWSNPYNVSASISDCVIISDWNKKNLIITKSKDTLIKVQAKYGCVKDAYVCHHHLYTAYADKVTVRSFVDSIPGPEVLLTPAITDIISIIVLSDQCIYLLSGQQGRIMQYNRDDNSTGDVVCTLQQPERLCKAEKDHKDIFLLSSYEPNPFCMFDENWRCFLQISTSYVDMPVMKARGATSTPDGILVADHGNKRVSLISFEGKFLKHVLESKHGLGKPKGLTFVYPYLWVTQYSPDSVKCFKICDD